MDSRRQFARVGALGAAVGAAAWLSFAHLTARPAVETAPPLRASADLADKSAPFFSGVQNMVLKAVEHFQTEIDADVRRAGSGT